MRRDTARQENGYWRPDRSLSQHDSTAARQHDAAGMIGDTPNVNIVTRAWNLHWEDARSRATTFHIEGVEVPTASIEDLIESKRTGHLQDAADIEVLAEIRRMRGP